jgi:hypothetical protein
MSLLLFILLVILVATFGFWDTLGALLGATVLATLVVIVGLAVMVVLGMLLVSRMRDR